MSDDRENSSDEIARRRLTELLENLKQQGITQVQVAGRVRLPAQYVSDMKSGSRTMTELFARRLQEEFGVNYLWLLGQSNTMNAPRLDAAGSPSGPNRIWLPSFPYPIEGDPYSHRLWDGTVLEVTGTAAARAVTARLPYILRFGATDHLGRLHRHDLVLMSQEVKTDAVFHVVKSSGKLALWRKTGPDSFERVAEKGRAVKNPSVIGHALGIIWSSL